MALSFLSNTLQCFDYVTGIPFPKCSAKFRVDFVEVISRT